MGLEALKALARRCGLSRRDLAAARMAVERTSLALLNGQAAPKPGGRILAYHAVGTPEWGVNDVRPERFEQHLVAALDAGYRFVPAGEIARGQGSEKDLAITFDDGIASVLEKAAPILSSYRLPWTAFVVSGWCEGGGFYHPELLMSWRDLEAVMSMGGTIGSHSSSHPDFGRLGASDSARELELSRADIEGHIGLPVREFAIPYGKASNWTPAAQDLAARAGYETVYAYCENRRFPGTIARTPVTRFDGRRLFNAALAGAFDNWHEWI
jgi:peptidoglycan/xylan/chitin deacetylase (PgdA/CDA1 family)